MVQEWNGAFPFPAALNCRLRSLQHTKTCSKGVICLFREGTSHLAVAIKWGPASLQNPKMQISTALLPASAEQQKQWTTWKKTPKASSIFMLALVLWSGTPWAQPSTSERDTAGGFGWIWCTGCLFCRDEPSPFPAPLLLQFFPTWQNRGAPSELMKILELSPAAVQISGMLASEPVWKYITEWACSETKRKNISTVALPEPPGPALAALHPCSCSNGYVGEKEEENLIKPQLNAISVKWISPNKVHWKINIVHYSYFTGKQNINCNR